jgi:hypothetical protein
MGRFKQKTNFKQTNKRRPSLSDVKLSLAWLMETGGGENRQKNFLTEIWDQRGLKNVGDDVRSL